LHLGNNLSWRRKFFIRGPDLRFSITQGLRSRKSWGSLNSHLLGNPTGSDPSLHILEGPFKVTNVGGELPGRINPFPMEGIPLS